MDFYGFKCSSSSDAGSHSLQPPAGTECNLAWGMWNSSNILHHKWDDLPGWQREAMKTCDLTKAWFDGDDPPGLKVCFADLNKSMQEAALGLGTDAHCWDQKFQVKGLNCTRLMQEEKSSARRAAICDEFLFKFQIPFKGLSSLPRVSVATDSPLNRILLFAPIPLGLVTYVLVTRRFWPACLLTPGDAGYSPVSRRELRASPE